METKQEARARRAKQTRRRIALARATRLCVFRTNSHIYAAVHSADGGQVLAAASTMTKSCVLSWKVSPVRTRLLQHWLELRLLSAPWRPVSAKLLLTVQALPIMVALKNWLTLRVKLA